MNTTTLLANASPAASKEVASNSGLQETLAKLNQLRAQLQEIEAQAAAEQQAEEKRQKEAQEAKEQARLMELADLPPKYGFADWREMVGFIGYHFLRGQKRPQNQVQRRRFNGRVQGLDHAKVIQALRDVPKTGKSVRQIAKEFGCAPMSVYLIAHSNHVPLPSQILSKAA